MPVTPRNMADSAKTHIATLVVSALEANADIADIPIFRCPKDITIQEIGIIPQGDDTGIDASNSSVWLVEVEDTAIATKTYDDDPAFPDKGVYDSLGSISSADRLEGDIVTVSVTNGTTAAPPDTVVQIEYTINENV